MTDLPGALSSPNPGALAVLELRHEAAHQGGILFHQRLRHRRHQRARGARDRTAPVTRVRVVRGKERAGGARQVGPENIRACGRRQFYGPLPDGSLRVAESGRCLRRRQPANSASS